MKKFVFLSALSVLSLAAVSCNEASVETPEVSEQIAFRAGGLFDATVSTKATEVTTSNLSTFNVNCVTGTLGSAETTVFNQAFTKSDNVFKAGYFWPTTDPSYKFYASNVELTPSASGPSVSAASSTDVVVAVLASPTFKAVNTLAFSHVFARITTVTINPPADGAKIDKLSLKVTPKTGGTYSLFSGNGKTDGTGWSTTSNGSETVLCETATQTANAVTKTNDLYLVPGTYTLTVSYTLSKPGYSEDFTKTATVSIVGGKKNTLNATLPNSNATEIEFSVEVASWEDNPINNITFLN